MKTIYSAVYNGGCFPFEGLAEEVSFATTPEELKGFNSALVLWGGADISPSIYGHAKGARTYASPQRDNLEVELVHKAIELGIPIIGVCRGAQLLCAMAGGYLIQHTTGHAGIGHPIETSKGEIIQVNSIHHQMMFVPEEVDHEVLAWSAENRSQVYLYGPDLDHEPPEKELEFVYFPKIKGYAIQWHPEAMSPNSRATKYILEELYGHGIK